MINTKKSTCAVAAAIGALFLNAGTSQAALVSYGLPSGSYASSNGNFTMLGANGTLFGGTNDVSFTWTGMVFTASSDYTGPGGASNATLSSPTQFYGYNWTVHDFQIFAPGSYSFNTALGGGYNSESGTLNLNVGAHQLGAHLLLDWGVATNIDIALLWNGNTAFSGNLWTGANNPAGNTQSTVWALTSVDGSGDGVPGIPMVSGGPFPSYKVNFNISYMLYGSPEGPLTPEAVLPTPVPIPAAMWLFGSGLLGLFGFVGKRKRY